MRILLFGFALAASAPLSAQPSAIDVRLANFKFEPRIIELKAGQDYALTLTNESSGGHSFSAKEFFAVSPLDAADGAFIHEGTVEVPGKQRRTIRFRAPAAGTYKVKCTHTLHGTFGMRGEIRVR